MPRASRGPYLYLKPERKNAAGKVTHAATWIIRDGENVAFTGLGFGEHIEAQKRLAAYIEEKHKAPREERGIKQVRLEDVIKIYSEDVAPSLSNPDRVAKRLIRLLGFWSGKTLDQVNGANCRAYAAFRGNNGGARRDLQDLSAAIQHHHKEGYHTADIRVSLPEKGGRRERWLTRSEVAKLVRTAWFMRENQRRFRGAETGQTLPTSKRTGRHVARAVLFAYYTCSRPGDALRASWLQGPSRSWIDLERGVFYRLPPGKKETNKRQPPIRLAPKLLAHIRRWSDSGQSSMGYVCEWEGRPVQSIKTALNSAVARAGLGDGVSTYTLRHSRITHLMQAGVRAWEVAGYAGTSEQMIEKHYGHHHPDHQSEAVNTK